MHQTSVRYQTQAYLRRLLRRVPPVAPVATTVLGVPRILVIVPGHLGDVIVATPALARLRASCPTARITALAGPWGRDVLDRCPDIDAVEICPFPSFDRSRSVSSRAGLGLIGRLVQKIGDVWRAERLRTRTAERLRKRFDIAVITGADFAWGAALACLAEVPIRIGFATMEARSFLSHPVAIGSEEAIGASSRSLPRPHAGKMCTTLVDVAIAIVRADTPNRAHSGIALPSHAPTSDDRESGDALRAAPTHWDGNEDDPPRQRLGVVAATQATPSLTAQAGLRYQPTDAELQTSTRAWTEVIGSEVQQFVIVHPVPGARVKRWSPTRWASVIDALHHRYSVWVVLTGTAGDRAEIDAIIAACTTTRLPARLDGRLTFGELGACMRRARMVIGPDGGALHLAGARGVPSVRLFGPTDPAVWGAWQGDASRPESISGLVVRDTEGVPVIHVQSPRRCAPCHRLDLPEWPVDGDTYPCMAAIETANVLSAIDELWRATDERMADV